MAFKALIFLGLLSVALGFTLPEEQFDGTYADSDWTYGDEVPIEDNVVLIRKARSPQGRFEGRFENSKRMGSIGSIEYSHPIDKNWDVYGKAERNFKYNDNSGHAGLKFHF